MGTGHLSLWTETWRPNSGTEFGVTLLVNASLLNSHYSLSALRHQIGLHRGGYINIIFIKNSVCLKKHWKIHKQLKCLLWGGCECETTQ